MVDPESGCALVYNGEIYNYVELRRQLETAGHHFRSAGDTEVLLRAYLAWGPTCLPRLNGMFAFALWDPREQAVLVARDRFGEKPLHMAADTDTVWFASEAQALLAAGVATARPDHDVLLRYLVTGDGGHPSRCAFAGIEQLPAAHAAWLRPGSGVGRPWRWWELPPRLLVGSPSSPGELDGVAEQADDLLADAVALRLRSDVEVGTSLSGGTDSSLVLDSIRRVRGSGTIHAFTASFPGSPTDELSAARALADDLGATLHPVFLAPEALERDLAVVVRTNERPVESASVVAQFAVMRAAAEAGVTVLLDGQGADETWAGYPKYAAMALTDDVLRARLAAARRRRVEWREAHGTALVPATSRYLSLVGSARVRRWGWRAVNRAWPDWISRSYRRATVDADPLSGATLPATAVGRVAADAPGLDVTRILLPRLLHYADRNSMRWSREVRLPFLDHRLVELAATTPIDLRLTGGWTKEPLRRALERRGRPGIARRPAKVAYMPPDTWMDATATVERTRAAWDDLFSQGLLASPHPVGHQLARWRVLALATWADEFGVRLG
jgi:asparagine synthase (glutamine-hydrolysing)